MTAIVETTQAAPIQSETEKKVRGFIQAVLLARPDLEKNLSLAACVNYLQLPDSTFGWDAYKEQGRSMPIEYKFACLLPTIVNDLTVGSICWLGNRPYARVEAFKQMAKKEFTPVSGLKFRKLEPEEKEMYAIGDKDMAVVSFMEVIYNNNMITIEGLGIIGWDESQPNAKQNYKVARELTRDRAQFVRTRAERDMLRRHITISGVPMEDEYEAPEVQEPVKHDAQKIIDLQHQPSKAVDTLKAEEGMKNQILLSAEKGLRDQVTAMGGDPHMITANFETNNAACVKLLQHWIDENSNPPEPPKPKKTRSKKAEAQEPVDEAPIEVVPDLMNDEPLDESKIETLNYIADSAEEFEDFQHSDEEAELYTGTDDQKAILRQAVKLSDLPKTKEMLMAISAGMRGQPMSKLSDKIKAFGETTALASEMKPAHENPLVNKLEALCGKVVKAGGKLSEICGPVILGEWDDWSEKEFLTQIKRLEDWYKKHMMNTKKD